MIGSRNIYIISFFVTLHDLFSVESLRSCLLYTSILGDKMSPLSSSVVLACQLTDTTSIGSMKAAAATNLPSFIVSAVIYILLGMSSADQPVSQASEASDLLKAISGQFDVGIITLLPPVLLIALILLKIPTIPAFMEMCIRDSIWSVSLSWILSIGRWCLQSFPYRNL